MLARVGLRSYCTWRFIPVSRGRPPRQLTETAVRPSLSRLSTIRADFTEVVDPWAKIIELFTAGFAQGLHFVPVTRGRVRRTGQFLQRRYTQVFCSTVVQSVHGRNQIVFELFLCLPWHKGRVTVNAQALLICHRLVAI